MKRMIIVTAGLLLSGCAAIPNSGPVVQGPRIDVVGSGGYVRVIARPPSAGMSPEALVRGFLDASASLTDGDATARLYLTTSASRQWNPLRRTEVYDAAALTITSERGDRVRIAAPLIGSLDATRRYTVAAAGTNLTESLQLEQQDGEWRIASPPAALYLGEGDIARSFRAHPVYFLDQTETQVVPEYVLLPIGATSPESLLVRALLGGPSEPAGRSLHSAIPAGTVLASSGVSIDGGTATVHLSGFSTGTSLEERRAIIAQVAWTLTQLPTVGSVRVLLNGEGLTLANNSTLHGLAEVLSFDPAPEAAQPSLVYVQGDRVLLSRSGKRTVLSAGTTYSAIAQSRSGLIRLAVAENRKVLSASVDGAAMRAIALGNDLAAPSVLPTGEGWFVDREARGGLFTWMVGARPASVKIGLPPRARVLDYAVAPDATRIALIVNDGATTTLRVGLIVRSEGRVEVTALRRVEQRLASAAAVAWQSESELTVLGSVGTTPAQPVTVTLPLGVVTSLGGPANVVSLTAAPGAPIVVGDQAGQLWEYSFSRWNASDLGAAPHYVP